MKKVVILFLLIGLLAACSDAPSASKDSVTPSSTLEITTSETITTSQTNSSGATTLGDAFFELTKTYPNVKMPRKLPRDESLFLNIAAVGDQDDLSVLYYNLPQAFVMNQRALNQATPFASFKKVNYDTVGKAKEAVGYQYDDGGQRVDLGHRIAAYQQSGAGSTYLSWKEGNWSLLVRASNVLGQEPVTAAKEIIDYLEKAFLPIPKSVGQIVIDLSTTGQQANKVTWQEDKTVYTVSHEDPLPALEMAVSLE